MNIFKEKSWLLYGAFIALGLGVVLRLWQITNNQFLFYDEGMYLGYNREFLNLVSNNPPKDIQELFVILSLMFKIALGTAKALWFFILNLRVFCFGADAWYFPRIISAVAGILTVVLVYFFAKQYFKSQRVALLSAVFLSLLPSHVFYSRLGMQESFSTLLFLSAIFLYILVKQKWSPFVSGILFACVFLTNYRMIIVPVFILFIELFLMFKEKRSFDWIRFITTVFVFGSIVFIVGSLYDGINRYVTFGWMSHQAQEAKSEHSFLSFLSFPYYTFALEGIFFALMFWSNLYLISKKEYSKLFAFVLVLLQMGIFSLAAEKGARYLCVVLPFMAIAAAVSIDTLIDIKKFRPYFLWLIIISCSFMAFHSFRLMSSTTSYKQAIDLIRFQDNEAKIISTQPLVEGLYLPNEKAIHECPKNLLDLIKLYEAGYRYLVIDPQVYISWTKSTKRFDPLLIDFLESIDKGVQPLSIMDHLDPVLLNRFVLDHNQNLVYSLNFLNLASRNGYGQIRIYDMGKCLEFLKNQATQIAIPSSIKNMNL